MTNFVGILGVLESGSILRVPGGIYYIVVVSTYLTAREWVVGSPGVVLNSLNSSVHRSDMCCWVQEV